MNGVMSFVLGAALVATASSALSFGAVQESGPSAKEMLRLISEQQEQIVALNRSYSTLLAQIKAEREKAQNVRTEMLGVMRAGNDAITKAIGAVATAVSSMHKDAETRGKDLSAKLAKLDPLRELPIPGGATAGGSTIKKWYGNGGMLISTQGGRGFGGIGRTVLSLKN